MPQLLQYHKREGWVREGQAMSVIVALVSKLDGVAASDGRTFGSVHLVNGVAEGQAGVSSDEFDKTFSLDNGRVIGAYCGLMSFSGATVAEHIIHMVGTIPQVGMDFSSIVEQVKEGMTAMLNGIDDCEVIRSCRGIDLLLVAGRRLTRRRHAIASIRFLPVDGVVTTEVDLVEADSSQPLRYYVYGEEQARPAAVKRLLPHAETRLFPDCGHAVIGKADEILEFQLRCGRADPYL